MATQTQQKVLRIELYSIYQAILKMVYELNQTWSKHVIYAEVYPLPLLKKAQIPDQIFPALLSGDEAIQATAQALGQFNWVAQQHAATVMRIPGVIVLDKTIQYRFAAINEAKSSLQTLISTHYKPGSRARITQRLFKGISMLQLYRHIFAFDEPIKKIIFSWAGRTHSSKKLTEIQVVDLLERSRLSIPLTHSYDEWQKIIDMELSQLAYSPSNSHYRLHRPIAPHPRAMIYHQHDNPNYQKHDAMLHANLPIFTYLPPDGLKPDIKALKPWFKDQLTQIRKDKLNTEVVVQALHLYRFTE